MMSASKIGYYWQIIEKIIDTKRFGCELATLSFKRRCERFFGIKSPFVYIFITILAESLLNLIISTQRSWLSC